MSNGGSKKMQLNFKKKSRSLNSFTLTEEQQKQMTQSNKDDKLNHNQLVEDKAILTKNYDLDNNENEQENYYNNYQASSYGKIGSYEEGDEKSDKEDKCNSSNNQKISKYLSSVQQWNRFSQRRHSSFSKMDKSNKEEENKKDFEGMTMSMIDNFLLQSAQQNNDSISRVQEKNGNITDTDLRKQLIRYDTEDMTVNTFLNAHDLSYSSFSQMNPSASLYFGDNNASNIKDETTPNVNNLLSILQANASYESIDKEDIQLEQVLKEKTSKYFQKFIKGENLNDSSAINSGSVTFDHSNLISSSRGHTRNFITDAPLQIKQTQETLPSLKYQKLDSTSKQRGIVSQNKILMEGYRHLQKQVEILSLQVERRSQKNNHKQDEEFKRKKQEDHLIKFLSEMSQKQIGETERLRIEVLELKQWKKQNEEILQRQEKTIQELQEELKQKEEKIIEKNSEIKRLFQENDQLKTEKYQSAASTSKESKISPKGNNQINKNSFYSEKGTSRQQQSQQSSPYKPKLNADLSVRSIHIPLMNHQQNKEQIFQYQTQLPKQNSENQSIHNTACNYNQYLNDASDKFNQNKSIDSSSNKINIDIISSEIKQLKNSLLSTDQLLKTTKNTNQVLGEKVFEAEQMNLNLENRKAQANTNKDELAQQFSRSSKQFFQGQNLFRHQLNLIDQEKDKLIQNDTSQSDVQPATNIYTPREISQNFLLPLKSLTEQNSYNNIKNNGLRNNDQNLNNQKNNYISSNNNKQPNNDGKNFASKQGNKNLEQSYLENNIHFQKSNAIDENMNRSDILQDHQLSIIGGGGYPSDGLSSHSHSQINNKKNPDHERNNALSNNQHIVKNNNNFESIQKYQKGSQEKDQYQKISNYVQQYQEKFNEETFQPALITQQFPPSTVQSPLNQRTMIQSYQAPKEDEQIDLFYQNPSNNYYLTQFPPQQERPEQRLIQQEQHKLMQQQQQKEFQENQSPQKIIQKSPYIIQPFPIQNQQLEIPSLQFPLNFNQQKQNSHYQSPSPSAQSVFSIQNNKTFFRGDERVGVSSVSTPIKYNHQLIQTKDHFNNFDPYMRSNSSVSIQPKQQKQYSTQLNMSHSSNNTAGGRQPTVISAVFSAKGEKLKKLNQQLMYLQLEKNKIESELLKQTRNDWSAIPQLNQQLEIICRQISEVRSYMMEQLQFTPLPFIGYQQGKQDPLFKFCCGTETHMRSSQIPQPIDRKQLLSLNKPLSSFEDLDQPCNRPHSYQPSTEAPSAAAQSSVRARTSEKSGSTINHPSSCENSPNHEKDNSISPSSSSSLKEEDVDNYFSKQRILPSDCLSRQVSSLQERCQQDQEQEMQENPQTDIKTELDSNKIIKMRDYEESNRNLEKSKNFEEIEEENEMIEGEKRRGESLLKMRIKNEEIKRDCQEVKIEFFKIKEVKNPGAEEKRERIINHQNIFIQETTQNVKADFNNISSNANDIEQSNFIDDHLVLNKDSLPTSITNKCNINKFSQNPQQHKGNNKNEFNGSDLLNMKISNFKLSQKSNIFEDIENKSLEGNRADHNTTHILKSNSQLKEDGVMNSKFSKQLKYNQERINTDPYSEIIQQSESQEKQCSESQRQSSEKQQQYKKPQSLSELKQIPPTSKKESQDLLIQKEKQSEQEEEQQQIFSEIDEQKCQITSDFQQSQIYSLQQQLFPFQQQQAIYPLVKNPIMYQDTTFQAHEYESLLQGSEQEKIFKESKLEVSEGEIMQLKILEQERLRVQKLLLEKQRKLMIHSQILYNNPMNYETKNESINNYHSHNYEVNNQGAQILTRKQSNQSASNDLDDKKQLKYCLLKEQEYSSKIMAMEDKIKALSEQNQHFKQQLQQKYQRESIETEEAKQIMILIQEEMESQNLHEVLFKIKNINKNYKQEKKFISCILDMVNSCDNQTIDEKIPSKDKEKNQAEYGNLKRAWKWLKFIMEDYVVMKRSQQQIKAERNNQNMYKSCVVEKQDPILKSSEILKGEANGQFFINDNKSETFQQMKELMEQNEFLKQQLSYFQFSFREDTPSNHNINSSSKQHPSQLTSPQQINQPFSQVQKGSYQTNKRISTVSDLSTKDKLSSPFQTPQSPLQQERVMSPTQSSSQLKVVKQQANCISPSRELPRHSLDQKEIPNISAQHQHAIISNNFSSKIQVKQPQVCQDDFTSFKPQQQQMQNNQSDNPNQHLLRKQQNQNSPSKGASGTHCNQNSLGNSRGNTLYISPRKSAQTLSKKNCNGVNINILQEKGIRNINSSIQTSQFTKGQTVNNKLNNQSDTYFSNPYLQFGQM